MSHPSLLDSMLASHGAAVPPPTYRWRTRIVLPALIVGASALLILAAAWSLLRPATEVIGTPVVMAVAGVSSGDAGSDTSSTVSVQAAGWVEPSPYPSFATALTEGVIDELLVLEGDRVVKGQPIARLVALDAEIARDRSKAELAKAEALVQAAEKTLANTFALDQEVRVTAARMRAAAASIAELDATIEAAKAVLQEIEAEIARKRPLVEHGAVSELEFAQLAFRRTARSAELTALTAKRGILDAAHEEAVAMHDAAARSRELLVAEQAALSVALGERAIAESALKEAELRLQRTTIVSPTDGVVLARLVTPGMMVAPSASSPDGGRVLSLYNPSELQVRADVPNADIALVGVGQRAEIKIEALPDATLSGEVLRLTAQADIAKNTVQVKVRIIDPPPEIRPEMLCRVKIAAGGTTQTGASGRSLSHASSRPRQRLFALRKLLGEREGKPEAMVADELRDGHGVAAIRSITQGSDARGEWVEITEGLRPGDVLVDYRAVAPGQRLRVDVQRSSTGGIS